MRVEAQDEVYPALVEGEVHATAVGGAGKERDAEIKRKRSKQVSTTLFRFAP